MNGKQEESAFSVVKVKKSQNRIDIDVRISPNVRANSSIRFFSIDIHICSMLVTKFIWKHPFSLTSGVDHQIALDFSEYRHRCRIIDYLDANWEKLLALPSDDNSPINISVAAIASRTGLHRVEFPLLLPDGEEAQAWADVLFSFFDYDPRVQRKRDKIRPVVTPMSQQTPGEVLPIAFYLPQYHPTVENDEWWGPGYTEWTGIVTNKPQFKGHTSPNIPADFGFYDPRLEDVRKKQGELASQYGIFGFCYYFYWFSGRRILEKPLEELLHDGEPALPFCLCWANETWSRRWDGSESEVLLAQKHSHEADLEILNDLLPFFLDRRYIRIDGKPLLLIYRINLIPAPSEFIQKLRDAATQSGLSGLFICCVMSFGITNPLEYGCDASVEFPPHNVAATEIQVSEIDPDSKFQGKIYDYADLVARVLTRPDKPYPYFPGVMPRWDNSARRGVKANVFHRSTPETFAVWLQDACSRTKRSNSTIPFVFINSWNEWSEGAHLEPDRRFQRSYLEAVRSVVTDSDGITQLLPNPSIERLLREVELARNEVKLAASNFFRSKILEGFPDHIASLPQSPGTASHVDMINGQHFSTNFVAEVDAGMHVKGWVVADVNSGAAGAFGFLVLEHMSGKDAYYAPVLEFRSRPDVATKFGTAGDRLGFEIQLAELRVKIGVYRLRFIEIISGRAFHHMTTAVLHVV